MQAGLRAGVCVQDDQRCTARNMCTTPFIGTAFRDTAQTGPVNNNPIANAAKEKTLSNGHSGRWGRESSRVE